MKNEHKLLVNLTSWLCQVLKRMRINHQDVANLANHHSHLSSHMHSLHSLHILLPWWVQSHLLLDSMSFSRLWLDWKLWHLIKKWLMDCESAGCNTCLQVVSLDDSHTSSNSIRNSFNMLSSFSFWNSKTIGLPKEWFYMTPVSFRLPITVHPQQTNRAKVATTSAAKSWVSKTGFFALFLLIQSWSKFPHIKYESQNSVGLFGHKK